MEQITRDERQDLAIQRWKEAKGRGIILATVGFGKTRIAIKIIKRLLEKKSDAKIIIIVPSDYLKDQWMMQLAENQLLTQTSVLVINSALAKSYPCDLLVMDEQHEYASTRGLELLSKLPHKLFLGLTATLKRLDGKEKFLLRHAPVVDEITKKEALENGWVAESNHYKVIVEVDLEEYKAINAKFLNHFAFFEYDFDLAMNAVSDYNVRLEYAKTSGHSVKDVTLHAMQFMKALTARKNFVHTHPKKVELANLIISHRLDKKIITFSQTKATAEQIHYGIVLHSGQTKKVRKQLMETFNEADSGIINSARALERGADIKNLSVAINVSINSSPIANTQKGGRVTRKEGDKIAEKFTLVIAQTMEEQWFKKAMEGDEFIPITEDQLIKLLKGEEYKVAKDTVRTAMFRF